MSGLAKKMILKSFVLSLKLIFFYRVSTNYKNHFYFIHAYVSCHALGKWWQIRFIWLSSLQNTIHVITTLVQDMSVIQNILDIANISPKISLFRVNRTDTLKSSYQFVYISVNICNNDRYIAHVSMYSPCPNISTNMVHFFN